MVVSRLVQVWLSTLRRKPELLFKFLSCNPSFQNAMKLLCVDIQRRLLSATSYEFGRCLGLLNRLLRRGHLRRRNGRPWDVVHDWLRDLVERADDSDDGEGDDDDDES